LSDGKRTSAEVVAAYRDAGYDFIVLSDHFEAEYGWQITDTRPLRDESFTTIVGAEFSSAPWEERDAYWVTAAGIPMDFDLAPFRGSYCRVTVVDVAGRRAWSNPIWP
jgi:hypothetical protein